MAFERRKHNNCSVIGCRDEQESFFLLPSYMPQKNQWNDFIFSGKAPTQLPKVLHVCGKHFTDDYVHNVTQQNDLLLRAHK